MSRLRPAAVLLPAAAALAIGGRRRVRRAAVAASVAVTAYGLEDVAEARGPLVFAANRPSALDAPLLASVLEPAVGPVVVLAGVGRSGSRATRLARRTAEARAALALRSGRSVLVFAEAVRSDDGALRPFDDRAARLAVAAGVPLVPVAVSGSFSALPPWRALPRAGRRRVTVTIGRPIPAAPGDEPGELARRAEHAVATALAGATGSWYAATSAAASTAGTADGDDVAATAPSRARWRRIWDSTNASDGPARRRTWR